MNAFLMIVKIILLIATVFTGLGGIGVAEEKMGDRCIMLTAIYAAALVALLVFCD